MRVGFIGAGKMAQALAKGLFHGSECCFESKFRFFLIFQAFN